MSQMKSIVGLLLFTSLMLIKVSALHVYTHHDNDGDAIENCEICDIVFESQSNDFEIAASFSSHISATIILHPSFTEKAQIFSGEPKVHQLFSRPPPFL